MTPQLISLAIATFLASTVEFVEAFTIVLVVGVTINWRSSIVGSLAAVGALAVIVAIFGVAIVAIIPIELLRLLIGFLLLLFGLKWLKKAIMRYAGLKALHDEEAIYEEQKAEMRRRGEHHQGRIDPFGVATAFKSVLLEGLEVAFIVITFGSEAKNFGTPARVNFSVAIGGALVALAVVALAGLLVRAPLQRVPENTLKFVVGVMLTSFGTFWGGEGLGIEWWNGDISILLLIALYLVMTFALVVWLRTTHRRMMERRGAASAVSGGAL